MKSSPIRADVERQPERFRRHWWNNKSELVNWVGVYDRKQSEWDRDTETQLGRKIRLTRSLTKTDLATMLDWKFQRIPGRLKRNLARLVNFPDDKVTRLFTEAIGAIDEVTCIRKLDELPSVGPAMISVLLTFYNPDEYGVLDIHVWRELFGPEPRDLFQGPKCLLTFLYRIRIIARTHHMSARDVEKAIFQRNYDEPLRMN